MRPFPREYISPSDDISAVEGAGEDARPTAAGTAALRSAALAEQTVVTLHLLHHLL